MEKILTKEEFKLLNISQKYHIYLDTILLLVKLKEKLVNIKELKRINEILQYVHSSELYSYLFPQGKKAPEKPQKNPIKESFVKGHMRKRRNEKALPKNTPVTIIDHTIGFPDEYIDKDGVRRKKIENKVVNKTGFIPSQFYIEQHLYAQYEIADYEPEKDEDKIIILYKNPNDSIKEKISHLILDKQVNTSTHVNKTSKIVSKEKLPSASDKSSLKFTKKGLKKMVNVETLSASPNMVATISIYKFADALPLYRIEKIFKRYGLSISRQTMNNWLLAYAELLHPLYDRLLYYILECNLINQDETNLQVLHHPNSTPQSKHALMVRIGRTFLDNGEESRFVTQFKFLSDKQAETLCADTVNFKGYIMTDGLKAYNPLSKHLSCWVHAVRQIKNILKKNNASQECQHIVKLVGQLFTIEKKLRNNLKEQVINKDTFMQQRQEQTQEVFQKLHDYIYAIKDDYTPRSAMGKALNYFVTYWDTLIQYPQCFESDPSDNLSERQIKDVVIGRNYVL